MWISFSAVRKTRRKPLNACFRKIRGRITLSRPSGIWATWNTVWRCFPISAITAIVVSCIGVITAALTTVPKPVLGGIMILLFGMIASIGINSLINGKVNFMNTKNQIIASVILVIGIGGAQFTIGSFQMSGIGLCSIVGILLNLLLPENLNFTKVENEVDL